MIKSLRIVYLSILFLLATTYTYGNTANVICTYSEEDAVAAAVLNLKTLQYSGNVKGVLFQCKHVSLKEFVEKNEVSVSLQNATEKDYVCFELESKGFHPGDRYALYLFNRAYSMVYVDDVIADSHGQLAFIEKEAPCYLCLVSAGFLNGERNYCVLISEDKQTYLAAAFIAYPIEYKWNDGAYVCAEILDACSFVIVGQGFQSNEKLILISESCGERIPLNSQVDSDGILRVSLHPKMNNVNGGSAKFIVGRRTTKEVGTLNYLWGDAAARKAI